MLDDLVIALTYYSPYVSGLTNFARDVAEGLAERGKRVRVVTTRHDPSLPHEETINGVRVSRAPVLAKLGKGVISPAFAAMVREASANARVLNLHLPMLEAGPVAALAKCPVVVTYHCDVSLPPGAVNAVQGKVIDASSRLAMRRAAAVAVTSEDYARASRLWPSIRPHMAAIPPPCRPVAAGTPRFRDGDGPHVGFLGRIVEEKGVEHLVDGFRALPDPSARLLIGGDFGNVAGGSVIDRVRAHIAGDPRIKLLGFVPDEDLGDFYASLDVFALPSVNAFEAFGIVQVVAMLAGVPVLASDLPGVRIPVRETGFGVVVPPGDAAAITAGLSSLFDSPPMSDGAADARYSVPAVLDAFEALFEKHARPAVS
ncbi:glycosyltransferase family 4 protein [Lentzea sp. NBRC 102530]|uniref:glycosyltransferase family 4 protein n=1 Tax=Lentzea sp. NBRC 102530 TaxID=3032201 RepID=UPI0024A1E89F|nr:glycosyltransferase family 4 protein [Lentzea sp. NBRC 102530]GLY46603.1 glycosyl transferase family 1 [Lentzea sp. NBRC 102530]